MITRFLNSDILDIEDPIEAQNFVIEALIAREKSK